MCVFVAFSSKRHKHIVTLEGQEEGCFQGCFQLQSSTNWVAAWSHLLGSLSQPSANTMSPYLCETFHLTSLDEIQSKGVKFFRGLAGMWTHVFLQHLSWRNLVLRSVMNHLVFEDGDYHVWYVRVAFPSKRHQYCDSWRPRRRLLSATVFHITEYFFRPWNVLYYNEI